MENWKEIKNSGGKLTEWMKVQGPRPVCEPWKKSEQLHGAFLEETTTTNISLHVELPGYLATHFIDGISLNSKITIRCCFVQRLKILLLHGIYYERQLWLTGQNFIVSYIIIDV